jgi:antitoxin (DNA-binding transcriptional repressor) of toxin-antitoxin stability system
MSTVKAVAVAEFREKFAEHLMSSEPIAITKHGLTVGYYIPTHRPTKEADKQALTEASRKLSELLEAQGLDPEELIRDAIALRKQDKHKRHG